MVFGDSKAGDPRRNASTTNRETNEIEVSQVRTFDLDSGATESGNTETSKPRHRRQSSGFHSIPGIAALGDFGKKIQSILVAGNRQSRRKSKTETESNSVLPTMHEQPNPVQQVPLSKEYHTPGEGRVLSSTRRELDQKDIDRLLRRVPSSKLTTVKNMFSSHSAWKRSKSGKWIRSTLPSTPEETKLESSNPMFKTQTNRFSLRFSRKKTPATVPELKQPDESDEDSSSSVEVAAMTIEEEPETPESNDTEEPLKSEPANFSPKAMVDLDGVGPVSASPFSAGRSLRRSSKSFASSFYGRLPRSGSSGYFYGGNIFTGGSFFAPAKTKTKVDIRSHISSSGTDVRFYSGTSIATGLKKKKPQWKMVGGRWIRAVARKISIASSRDGSRKGSASSQDEPDV